MTDFGAPQMDSSEPHDPLPLEIETADGVMGTSYIATEPVAPKRKVRVLALAVGLVAAMGAGAFAVTQLGDSVDGADSPRAALDQMISAINSSDILGVFEALPPGERTAMLDPIKNLNTELQRIGIVSKDNDLKAFKGAGIKITGVEATATKLSDSVASIDISKASVESSFDMSKLPIGDELKKLAFKDGVPTKSGTSTGGKTGGEPIHLMAIKEGGGWHMSMFYSAADAIRRGANAENPAFGQGVKAVGGDTAEAAAKDMLSAIGALDVKRLVELMPPDEMRALHDYAPLFLDNATKAIADFKAKTPFELNFDGTQFTSTIVGDQATVGFKSMALSAKFGAVDMKLKTDGKCATFDMKNTSTSEVKAIDTCKDATDPSTKKVTDALKEFRSTLNLNSYHGGLMFIQRDGKWYFSPTRTILDLFAEIIKILNQNSIEKGVSSFNDLVKSNPILSQLRGNVTGQSTIDTSVKTPPAPAPLGLSAQGQVALDTCTAAATASPSTADGAAFTKAILGCLAPYISDGTIDANYLSLQAVAPDCYIAVNALVAANATGAEISAGYSTADLCATKRLQTTP